MRVPPNYHSTVRMKNQTEQNKQKPKTNRSKQKDNPLQDGFPLRAFHCLVLGVPFTARWHVP